MKLINQLFKVKQTHAPSQNFTYIVGHHEFQFGKFLFAPLYCLPTPP